MACLVVVAIAALMSSVAVMMRYESRYAARASSPAAGHSALASFVDQANKYCATTLPSDRPILSAAGGSPAVVAAVGRVDLLRQRLQLLPTTPQLAREVRGWLASWRNFTEDEARYVSLTGAARPGDRSAGSEALHQRDEAAALADKLGASLGVADCRLEAAAG
jgi:hypothetical protein